MSNDDDDIARLLREVEAATGGGKPASPPPASDQSKANLPAATQPSGKEVARPEGGSSAVTHLLVAGAAGGIVAFLVFGILPFIDRLGVISLAMAGFVGGAVGYGTTRLLRRGGGD
jgi:hypothetical protein